MRIVLGLVLVVLAALALRWLMTARRQRFYDASDEHEPFETHVPLRPSGQVFRALRAARPTQVRYPQQPPEPGSGPMLRP